MCDHVYLLQYQLVVRCKPGGARLKFSVGMVMRIIEWYGHGVFMVVNRNKWGSIHIPYTWYGVIRFKLS